MKLELKKSDINTSSNDILPTICDGKKNKKTGELTHRYFLYATTDAKKETINVKRTAVVIGLNPSTACAGDSDATFTKTGRYLAQYGIDDFYMLNLFETVNKDPNKIKSGDQTDWDMNPIYQSLFDRAYIIVLAWGTTKRNKDIEKAEYSAVKFLKDNGYLDKAFCVADKGTGKLPLHPRVYSYDDELTHFDFELWENMKDAAKNNSQ